MSAKKTGSGEIQFEFAVTLINNFYAKAHRVVSR